MSKLLTPEHYDHIVSINVDIQNDFCPGGALGVHDGDQVVEPMNAVNRYVRDNNGTVIFTRDWHPRATNHFNTHGGPWPPHCIAYQAGAAFHEDLIVDTAKGDYVASKGTRPDVDDYSGLMAIVDGFSLWNGRDYTRSVSVSDMLRFGLGQAIHERRLQIKKLDKIAVLVGGLATDYCVKATALDVVSEIKRADVFLIEDAVRAVNVSPDDGAQALIEMRSAGIRMVTSNDITAGKILEAVS